jgi:hypothetical protein
MPAAFNVGREDQKESPFWWERPCSARELESRIRPVLEVPAGMKAGAGQRFEGSPAVRNAQEPEATSPRRPTFCSSGRDI